MPIVVIEDAMADKFDDMLPKVLPLLRMLVPALMARLSIRFRRCGVSWPTLASTFTSSSSGRTVYRTARQQLYDFGYEDGRAMRQKSSAARRLPPTGKLINLMTNSTMMSGPASGLARHHTTPDDQPQPICTKDQSIVESVYRGLFSQGFVAPTPKQARWIRDIFIRQFAGTIT
jgi:hypothetical protein